MGAGPHNAADVKSTVLIKVLVFYGYCGVFHIRRNLVAFNRYTLDGIVVLPQHGLAGTVVISNAAAQVIARDVFNFRQIFAEVGK